MPSQITEVKLKIIELNTEVIDLKQFSEKVLDILCEFQADSNDYMTELLSKKLNDLKPKKEEEEKKNSIQPQSQIYENFDDDPYTKAKQMIDDFKKEMIQLEQNEISLIEDLEKSIQLNKMIIKRVKTKDCFENHESVLENKLYDAKLNLENRGLAEKMLCTNLAKFMSMYSENYQGFRFSILTTPLEQCSKYPPQNWYNYPTQEIMQKLSNEQLLNCKLKKVFWKFDGVIKDLRFQFEYQNVQNTEQMESIEIPQGKRISKIEYWKSISQFYGFSLLTDQNEEIISIGEKSLSKHSVDLKDQDLIGFIVGHYEDGDVTGIKVLHTSAGFMTIKKN